MCYLSLMYVFIFSVQFGKQSGRLLGKAAHSACDMISWYKYLSVILVFSHPRFMEWEFLSDCAISWYLFNQYLGCHHKR